MKKLFLAVIASIALPALVLAQNTNRPVVKKETVPVNKGGTKDEGKTEQSDPRPNATSNPDVNEDKTIQSDPRPNATSNPDIHEGKTEQSKPRPNATSNPSIPDKDKGNNNKGDDDDDHGKHGKGKHAGDSKNGHSKGHAYGHYKDKQEKEAVKARDKEERKK